MLELIKVVILHMSVRVTEIILLHMGVRVDENNIPTFGC